MLIMGSKSSKDADNEVLNTYLYVTKKERKKLLKIYPDIDFVKMDRILRRCINGANINLEYFYHSSTLTNNEKYYIRSNGHKVEEMTDNLNKNTINKIYVYRGGLTKMM